MRTPLTTTKFAALGALMTLCAGAGAAVPNDTIATATVINSWPQTFNFNTAQATSDGGDPGACNSSSATQMQQDVWFKFTAPARGVVTSVVSSPSNDHIMQYWLDNGSGPQPVGCYDEPEPTQLGIGVDPGNVIYYQIGDYGISPGGGPNTLQFNFVAVYDNCGIQGQLACGVTNEADLRFATNEAFDPVFPCRFGGAAQGFNSVWFTFTGTGGQVRLRTGSQFDAQATDSLLGVYTGSICGQFSPVACDDDSGPGNLSELTMSTVAGTTYWVQVAAYSQQTVGFYTITMECPADCTSCPASAVAESEVCEADSNGGCQSNNLVQTVGCSSTICGRVWNHPTAQSPFAQDQDWYEFSVGFPALVVLNVKSEFPSLISLATTACPPQILATVEGGDPCTLVQLTKVLQPGTYRYLVTPYMYTNEHIFCGESDRYTAYLVAQPTCYGDLNNDGTVNTLDLTALLAKFGQNVTPCDVADLDPNGAINTTDLVFMLNHFGTNCSDVRPGAEGGPEAQAPTNQ